MDKFVSIMVFTSLLLIFTLTNLSAALPPPSAEFNIDLSQFNLSDGDWQLSFMSISSYDTKNYLDIYDLLKEDYISKKELCGVPNYLQIVVNPSQEEISELESDYPAYSKSILNKGYMESDEIYYFLTDEKYKECITSIGYGDYNYLNDILEKNYKITQNFWIYHYDKLVNLKNEGEKVRSFYPTYCEIESDSCTIGIYENSQGPYLIVLEKMSSEDQVYFSEPVNINWNYSGDVEWKGYDSNNTYSLDVNQFELSDQNTLSINFEGSEEVEPVIQYKDNFYFWILGLGIILVLVVLIVILKKKRE